MSSICFMGSVLTHKKILSVLSVRGIQLLGQVISNQQLLQIQSKFPYSGLFSISLSEINPIYRHYCHKDCIEKWQVQNAAAASTFSISYTSNDQAAVTPKSMNSISGISAITPIYSGAGRAFSVKNTSQKINETGSFQQQSGLRTKDTAATSIR